MQHWLAMGGYGNYVWGAYGLAGGVLLGNVFYTRIQHRKIISQLRRYLTKQAWHASDS